MNADGTRTTYEFDSPQHRAIATTTGKDGKTVGKIRYTLDEAGRFMSGEVYGADDQLSFKALYKYHPAGNSPRKPSSGPTMSPVTRSSAPMIRTENKPAITVYDAAGKLIRGTPGVSPRPTPLNQRK
jgi:hypothetical protein